MRDLDSSQWANYQLMISGYCRNKAFICWSNCRSFQEFWMSLANHTEVPCDGEFLTNMTITSVMLVSAMDADWLRDNNLLSFEVE